MRKLVAAAFVSLDGVMQAPGGPKEDADGGFALGGWTFHHWDEVMGGAMDETFSAPFDLVLGRRTYDIFAAHWPRVPADDPLGQVFNRVTKHVATHRPDSLSWQNTAWLGQDVAAAMRDLKAGDGPDLLLQGSSDLIQQLLSADLIDTFRLLIFPVVLGGGKRLFGPGAIPAGLRLTNSQVSTTGVLVATYERAGDVTTGSFALE